MSEKIAISALIDAGIKKVWECYTQPEHIVHWNFASDDWMCPSATNDLRVGGTYKARMEAKDGSFGFDFEAVYDEIIPDQKIAYSLGDARKVIIQFTPSADQTRVDSEFDSEDQNPLDMQRQGWQSILDNFKKHTEQNS